MLISETHFTSKSYFNIPNYITYSTRHQDNKAHGESVIIINNRIKHNLLKPFHTNFLQLTNTSIKYLHDQLTISSIYCPPKHKIIQVRFNQFFKSLDNSFIAGGDFNAKHTHWGQRLVNPKGRELYNTVKSLNLTHIATSEPTYWPSNIQQVPICWIFLLLKVYQRITQKYVHVLILPQITLQSFYT